MPYKVPAREEWIWKGTRRRPPEQRRRRAGLPERYARATFRDFPGLDAVEVLRLDGTLGELARGYVEQFKEMRELGKGLVITGPPGVGKTTAGMLIAGMVSDIQDTPERAKYAVAWMRSHSLLERERDLIALSKYDPEDQLGWHEDRLHFLTRCTDLLVLDDVGREQGTEFSGTKIENLLRLRWDDQLPTIVTTNLDRKAIIDRYGAPTWDFFADLGVWLAVDPNTKSLRRA